MLHKFYLLSQLFYQEEPLQSTHLQVRLVEVTGASSRIQQPNFLASHSLKALMDIHRALTISREEVDEGGEGALL